MLKQIIVGSEDKKIKFHGYIKYIIFECNKCHKHFSKQESYYKKQLKNRKGACCFCSPRCRSRFLYSQSRLGVEKESVVTSWFHNLFHNW